MPQWDFNGTGTIPGRPILLNNKTSSVTKPSQTVWIFDRFRPDRINYIVGIGSLGLRHPGLATKPPDSNASYWAAADHDRKTTVRTIYDCRIEVERPEVQIVVIGSGFLYNMVRIIAGTLVEVGRGRFEPGVIDEIFKSGDRRMAGPTLPASGLCLEWIRYDEPQFNNTLTVGQND